MVDSIVREALLPDVRSIVDLGTKFLREGPYNDQIENNDQASKLAASVLGSPNGRILVSEGDGKVNGVFAFITYPHYFTGEMTALELIWYVEPEARAGGIAIKLLAKAEELARELGVKRMQLTAPTEDVGRLYKYCGGYKKLEVTYQRVL
jgi:GNAT superfamily N-acetyltransferase